LGNPAHDCSQCRRGARCGILNGSRRAPAVHPEAITTQRPRVALFDADNRVRKVVEYRVRRGRDGRLSLDTVPARWASGRGRRRRG